MRSVLLVALTSGALTLATRAMCAVEPLKIDLTVEERLGEARVNEPVTSGVPLPKGAVEDADVFRLVDEKGNVVPAAFSAATRWWPTKSIKWLHVDFLASVPAKGTKTYTLATGDPAPPVKTPLTVEKQDNGYLVNTGPLKFIVKEKGFSLFDEVWLEGKQLVKIAGGMVLENADGDTFGPHFFPHTSITVEQQNPMKVVLLVTTRNVKKDGSGYCLDSKIRIYAYANSPLVKVVYTVENRRGKWDEHVDVLDWSILLPAEVGAKPTFRFGLGKNDVTGTLGRLEQAGLRVLATDLYRFEGAAKGSGNPHKEQPARIGAIDLSGSNGGVTVGVKNFWQMWAKYLVALPIGLEIGLWDGEVRDKGKTTFVDEKGQAQFFAGVGRTHEVFFYFHGPDEKDPIARVAASREPLFARCDPYWYCRGTKVFGDLSEANLEIYDPRWRDQVKALNDWAEQSVKKPLRRWQTVRKGAIDSFGMLNYGDGVEEMNDGDIPERIHWEGGYYDYMHSIILQFARTSDLFYLWLANDQSRHNAEVHHTHHDKEPGRSRYCPSWAHIIMDDKVTKTYGGYYASGTFNHWKNLSAFERWYLLGDHRAREAALEITGFALRLGNSGIDFGQPRSICHGSLGFYAGWDATGEKKYMDAWAKFAKGTAKNLERRRMGSGGWQRGMALQGLAWYVEVTGDDSIVPMIEKHLERDAKSGTWELAYPRVFMWKRTRDPKYFHAAVRSLRGGASQWMQRFGNYGRSKLYVPSIVLKDAEPRPLPPKQP